MDSYDDFNELGAAFEKAHPNAWQETQLNHGLIKVIDVKPLVQFARKWFKDKDQKFGNSLD